MVSGTGTARRDNPPESGVADLLVFAYCTNVIPPVFNLIPAQIQYGGDFGKRFCAVVETTKPVCQFFFFFFLTTALEPRTHFWLSFFGGGFYKIMGPCAIYCNFGGRFVWAPRSRFAAPNTHGSAITFRSGKSA